MGEIKLLLLKQLEFLLLFSQYTFILQKIQSLPPQVFEKIAAGEVILQPSNVVKELTENALDAEATHVQIRLEDGGKTLIEVLDNGIGMCAEDLALCTKRHTTSKLHQISDLEHLTTLGFRGEALASITAVGDITIISAQKDQPAYCWKEWDRKTLGPDPITTGHFIQSSHGTCIQVKGLFSQYPARLKFLKSAASEAATVKDWLIRLALGFPEVTFEMKHNDKQIVYLPQSSREERLKIIFDDPLFEVHLHETKPNTEILLQMYWMKGSSFSNSKRLFQFVNRRPLKDKVIQQAVHHGFKQALLPGQYPGLAVYLELSQHLMDINVHPTKTEVRFLDQNLIFASISEAVKKMLQEQNQALKPPSMEYHLPLAEFSEMNTAFLQPKPQNPEPLLAGKSFLKSSLEEKPLPIETTRSLKFIGQFFSTYLLFEHNQTLIWMDQHAAHERICYEKITHKKCGSQNLLLKEIISLTSENFKTIQERLEGLKEYGFDWTYDKDLLSFHAVPLDWFHQNLTQRLKLLVEKCLEDRTLLDCLIDECVFEAKAQQACHNAIRAGQNLSTSTAINLYEKLFQCEHPSHCPHGRPTYVELKEAQLQKWFQRASSSSSNPL